MPHAGQTIKQQVRQGRDPNDCWQWLGPKTPDGHGKKTYCGRYVMAHRWMWEILNGPISPGLVVYRTCDAKDCTNPAHLRCGTQAAACRASVNTSLLASDVQDIRAAKATAGMQTANQLAERYGCSAGTIRDIWGNRTWARARMNYGPVKAR